MAYKLTEGFVPVSAPDPRDKIASLPRMGALPPAVDLKPLVFEVEDQGQYSSCTANAGCSALELMYKHRGTPVDLSRMFLYYYDRQIGGLRGDVGAYPRDIGRALLAYGTCLESTWDYTHNNLEAEPSPEAHAEAEQFKIASYEQIAGPDRLTQIRTAIAQQIPVLLAITLHNGVYNLSGPWQTHSWDYNSSPFNPPIGGHEVLIVGYDDNAQRLLIENSWGPGFADGGFFGLPYAMVNTPSFGETWVVYPK